MHDRGRVGQAIDECAQDRAVPLAELQLLGCEVLGERGAEGRPEGLVQTLQEEKQSDELLTEIAESDIRYVSTAS